MIFLLDVVNSECDIDTHNTRLREKHQHRSTLRLMNGYEIFANNLSYGIELYSWKTAFALSTKSA